MTVYTIGFTKKSAEKFFRLVRGSGTKRVVDVRLNNVSQLAGFAKPHHCHRRLVAEYLRDRWGALAIDHLV